MTSNIFARCIAISMGEFLSVPYEQTSSIEVYALNGGE